VNGNGALTEAEITSVLTSKGIAYDANDIHTSFVALDKDKDGKLSLAEFQEVKNPPFVDKFRPLLEKVLA